MRILTLLFFLLFSTFSYAENLKTDSISNIGDATVTIYSSILTDRKPSEYTIFDNLFQNDINKYKKKIALLSPKKIQQAIGSGFIFNEDRIIFTNYHVVKDAFALSVKFSDGTISDAKIMSYDESTDIALIQTDSVPSSARIVKMGDSDSLHVGDVVYAFGSPMGLDGTLTRGIVSHLNRELPDNKSPFNCYIQLDASINHGNSGGPLFNSNMEVVGMNTSMFSNTGNSIGLGFAIPSKVLKFVSTDLIAFNHLVHRYIGISIADLNDDNSIIYGNNAGVLITSVTKGSPSDGLLEKNDIILDIDGKSVKDINDVVQDVYFHAGNDLLNMKIIRNNQVMMFQIHISIQ